MDKSVIAEHAWTEDHAIHWDDTRILQCVSRSMELVVKEAICIQTALKINHDGGCNILGCLYKKIRGGAHMGHVHPTAS